MSDVRTPSESSGDAVEKPQAPEEQANTLQVPQRPKGIVWALVVVSILSSTFLFSLDNTIVADIQPAIIDDFNSINKLPWLSVAFLLGSASTNLTWGQFYAHFNAKWIYIVCVLLFEIGSAICGSAPNMTALIIGRAICGLGGAGMYTGVMVLLTVCTQEHERPIYFGLTGLTWGTGTILGPIIGGAFTDSSATWRWSFYINLCVGAACAPVYFFLLPSADPRPGTSLSDRITKIDFIGTILMCGIFVSGLMAIDFGGTQYAWGSGTIIALFVVAAVLIVIFFTQQIFAIGTTKTQRLFPLEFLKSKLMIMMFLATAFASTAIFVPVYFIPLYFQFVRGDGALNAGVRLLPYVVFNVLFAMINGTVMGKKPYYMPWYLFSGIFCVIGGATMYTVTETTSAANIYGYSIILGCGAGAFIQLSFTVVQSKIEKHLVPIATGFCTFAQLAGPAVALAISNAIFLNLAINDVRAIDPQISTQEIQEVISGASSERVLGSTAEVQQEALHAIVHAIRQPYVLVIICGGLTIIMAAFMKVERLFPAPEPKEKDSSSAGEQAA